MMIKSVLFALAGLGYVRKKGARSVLIICTSTEYDSQVSEIDSISRHHNTSVIRNGMVTAQRVRDLIDVGRFDIVHVAGVFDLISCVFPLENGQNLTVGDLAGIGSNVGMMYLNGCGTKLIAQELAEKANVNVVSNGSEVLIEEHEANGHAAIFYYHLSRGLTYGTAYTKAKENYSKLCWDRAGGPDTRVVSLTQTTNRQIVIMACCLLVVVMQILTLVYSVLW